MSYKKLFKECRGDLIWFGESEETSDLKGIVVGYNRNGIIVLIHEGNGDYELKPTDIVPNTKDRNNPQGYILNDFEYMQFE